MQTKTKTVVALNPKNWDKAPVRLEKASDLIFDWAYYPRKEVDHERVASYARSMDAGCTFPTVKIGLFHGKRIIVDGVHRFNAYQLKKVEYINCSELPFDNEAELFAEAVRLNASHGKSFTEVELQESVRRLKKYNFSIQDIQTITSIPASEIHRETEKPITTMTGPGGQKIHCDIQNKSCTGEPSASEMLQFKKELIHMRDVARKGCIPKDDYFKTLIPQCRAALQNLEKAENHG